MSDIVFLYCTAPDEATAATLAGMLVDRRLAACVNVLPGMKSIYRWNGAIETAGECAMLVKTQASRAAAAAEAIAAAHPYETPSITAFSSSEAGTLPAFASWVAAETAETS